MIERQIIQKQKFNGILCSCYLVMCLSSCQTYKLQPEQSRHASLVRNGASVEYADGYVDGCKTAQDYHRDPKVTPSKDSLRFAADVSYAVGWQHGYENCLEHIPSDSKQHKDIWKDLQK